MSQTIKRRRRRARKPEKASPERRYELVSLIDKHHQDHPHMSLSAACDTYNVPKENYRRWKAVLDAHPEYRKQGIVPDQSRRPKHLARQASEAIKQRVIAEASKPHHTSANSITQQLKDDGIAIGNGTVIEILEEAGLYGTIYKMNAQGELQSKRGLLRLCEKRQQDPIEKRSDR